MAKYNFNDVFNVPSFRKGFDEINSELDKLDDRISGNEKTRKGSGKQLLEELKQIDKLIESNNDLVEVELKRVTLEKQIAEASKKNQKETTDAIKTRAKAEKEAEKFLKQFNLQEVKRNEALKIRKKELRETAKNEIALEKIQKREVKTLQDLQDVNNALIRIRKNVDRSSIEGRKRYDELTIAIDRNNRELAEQDQRIGFFRRNVGNYISGIKGVTQSFGGLSGILGAAGIATGIGTVIAGFGNFINRAKELNGITRRIQNDFNVSGESARKYAAQVKALSTSFDEDYNEILKVANTASKEFGTSIDTVLADIEEGFRKGSNNTGEFLAILREYPAQAAAAGISQKEFFAIINQQVKEGIYTDKGIDAIKEAGLRLRENTKNVRDALAPLDESIKKQIQQEIAAGNSFKAIQLVSNELKNTSLTAEQTQKLIADVFGGAGEDAGLRYLQTLADINTNLDEVEDQISEVEAAQLGLSESYNGFVNSVAEGSGFISRAWAALQDGASNFLEQLTNLNNGVFKLTKVQKDYLGITELQENALKRQRTLIESSNNAEERQLVALQLRRAITVRLVELQRELQKAVDERNLGEIVNARESIETNKLLLEQTDQYINKVQESTISTDKNTESTDKNNQEKKKTINILKDERDLLDQVLLAELKLAGERKSALIQTIDLEEDIAVQKALREIQNEEILQRRLNVIREQAEQKRLEVLKKFEVPRLLQAQTLQDAINKEQLDGLEKFISDQNELINKNRKEQLEADLKAAEQAAEFKKSLEENIQTQINKTATSFLDASLSSSLTNIKRNADARTAILEDQLRKGIINEGEFQKQIEKLNKDAASKQASAEKKRVLFEIGINTALAAIKAAPNPFAIAGAIALGAAQAAIVAATPLPAFKKGKINIDGPGTSESDSIVARISKGESVVKASATKKSTGLLNLINDEVLNDRNAGDLLTNYTVNQLENKYMSKIAENTSTANKLMSELGIVMQRPDGSYIIVKPDGRIQNYNLHG